jgi:RsiW-degrading membrane proteinase PrsW (M82 family)
MFYRRAVEIGTALLFSPFSVWAQVAVKGNDSSPSVGAVAGNLTGATDIFNGVFSAIFYVIGITLVVASIMRYRDHRQNPSQTPISKVIFLFLAGLAIGLFPLIVNYLGGTTQHLNA